MIKFFRKIRQDLLSGGKIGKYLKYAIGEIILVVIGILIALSINNWNEERKAFTKSKNYLTEILRDLETDIIKFERGINLLSRTIQKEKWALRKTDYATTSVDSLIDSFGGWYFNYRINDRTFQKIQNNGDSKLIGFDSLMNNITIYYTEIKKMSDSDVDWDIKEVTERQTYLKDLEEYIEISNYQMRLYSGDAVEQEFVMMQDSLENRSRVIDFAKSTRGRNHLKNNHIRHLSVRNSFETVKQEALNLVKEINKELKLVEK